MTEIIWFAKPKIFTLFTLFVVEGKTYIALCLISKSLNVECQYTLHQKKKKKERYWVINRSYYKKIRRGIQESSQMSCLTLSLDFWRIFLGVSYYQD